MIFTLAWLGHAMQGQCPIISWLNLSHLAGMCPHAVIFAIISWPPFSLLSEIGRLEGTRGREMPFPRSGKTMVKLFSCVRRTPRLCLTRLSLPFSLPEPQGLCGLFLKKTWHGSRRHSSQKWRDPPKTTPQEFLTLKLFYIQSLWQLIKITIAKR